MIPRLTLCCVALLAMGAGPCDMFMPEEELLPDGGDNCGPTDCLSALTINVIRADNQSFGAGFYGFTLALPDTSSLSIECYLGHGEMGFECGTGNTKVLTALLGPGGGSIQILLLGAPEWTNVTIEYNGYTIGKRTLIPNYHPDSRSSDPCLDECVYAEEAMAVESW